MSLEAVINLHTLFDNIKAIKVAVKSRFCFVIKSDAYGHGLCDIANFTQYLVDEFAVATEDEAEKLFLSGITKPINILSCGENGLDYKNRQNIIPTVCSIRDFERIKNNIKTVNIKLNTGMNRIGAEPDELKELINYISKNSISTKSIFTHLYKAEDIYSADKQLKLFNQTVQPFRNSVNQLHCSASSSLFLPSEFHLDMVRIGLAAYGYSCKTKPVMSIYTNILQVRDVKAGEHISYGDYVAQADIRIAAIRTGYGDGYRRLKTGEKRYVSINGKLCRVIGQVCMDITLVDVTDINLKGDEKVYLLGEGITGEMLSDSLDTIIYEILTGFGLSRIKRKYIG